MEGLPLSFVLLFVPPPRTRSSGIVLVVRLLYCAFIVALVPFLRTRGLYFTFGTRSPAYPFRTAAKVPVYFKFLKNFEANQSNPAFFPPLIRLSDMTWRDPCVCPPCAISLRAKIGQEERANLAFCAVPLHRNVRLCLVLRF